MTQKPKTFSETKCMKRATWADCDSSHQNIWVGTLFWVSRRLHEKLKPGWWKFLSVTREGTGLRGLLWHKQSLDDVTEHWAEVVHLFLLGALDSLEGGFSIFTAVCESQFCSWTPQLFNRLLVPDRFQKTESGRPGHFLSVNTFMKMTGTLVAQKAKVFPRTASNRMFSCLPRLRARQMV